MERFIKGDVIVLPFPFTDLSAAKKRPALILSDIKGDDYIMLQITSKNVRDNYAISLQTSDFASGSLKTDSNIRPNKIFTLNKQLILYKVGHLGRKKLEECVSSVCAMIREE
ncbi:MAG: type II toxin-antitoxin system PemK/MazF family toxin [Eubacterium sp.]|nr:type II toxin-antitoxin system PemK/MazF family toxin [Eubacterium sp.]